MLSQMLQSQVSLKHFLCFLVIAGERKANHEFLLKSQILQVAIQYACKVVNRVAFHGQIKHNVGAADMSAHIDLLLHDCL